MRAPNHQSGQPQKHATESDFENLHEQIQDLQAESFPFDQKRAVEILEIEKEFEFAKKENPKALKPSYPRVEYRHMRIQTKIQVLKERLDKSLRAQLELEVDKQLEEKTFEEAKKHVAEKEAEQTPAPQE